MYIFVSFSHTFVLLQTKNKPQKELKCRKTVEIIQFSRSETAKKNF